MPSFNKIDDNQSNFAKVEMMHLNSASILECAIVSCLQDDQDIKVSPRYIKIPN